jgi:hypothetical protein
VARKGQFCACGCGGWTRGGKFLPGHNSKGDQHWSRIGGESQDVSVFNNMKKRRAKAYALMAAGETNKDFTFEFFRFFRKIRDVVPDAEMEVCVLTEAGYRSIDVGIVSLKLGFEYDPGNRYHLGTAESSPRDALLRDEGWKLIHCKDTPHMADIAALVDARKAELGPVTNNP